MWGSCSRSMQTNALPAVMLSATTFASSSRLPMKMTYAWTRGDWRASAAFSLRGVMPYRARLASLSTITIASSQSSLASSSTASSVAASVWSPLQQNWACACIILIVSSRRFASFGGLFSLTNGTATASPLCPTMSYRILPSNPSNASITITVASSSRSSRPSYPLNRYIDPDTSTTSLSRFGFSWGVPGSGSCSARCFPSTSLVSSSSPALRCRCHWRSRARACSACSVMRSCCTWRRTGSAYCSYTLCSYGLICISRSFSSNAFRFMSRAACFTDSGMSSFSASDSWCTLWPASSRYGPPLPPSPAVSRPPVPPAHVLPPTCGSLFGSTLPCFGPDTPFPLWLRTLQLALAAHRRERLAARGVLADRQPVAQQHRRHLVERFRRVPVVVEHVANDLGERVGREALQVAHDRDDLARRVRIVELAGVRHLAQLGERVHQPADRRDRHGRPVLLQQVALRLGQRIVDRVAREQIAQRGKEIVPEEGKAGPVRQHDHAEVGMGRQEATAGAAASIRTGRANLAPVGQQHLAVLDERLQYAGDVDGRLVRLVHHQHVPVPDRLHQRRVFVRDPAVPHRRLQRQRLDGGVAVQLDVLARPPHQLQQPVDDLVLADALVAHQQQMLAEQKVLQQPLHQPQVLRHVVEHNVRDLADRVGAVPRYARAPNPHQRVRLLHRDRGGSVRLTGRRSAVAVQVAAHRRIEHRARQARHKLAQKGGVQYVGRCTGPILLLPVLVQPAGDAQQLPGGQIAGERLLHRIVRGAQVVRDAQDLLHRFADRAVQRVEHVALLALAQPAHLRASVSAPIQAVRAGPLAPAAPLWAGSASAMMRKPGWMRSRPDARRSCPGWAACSRSYRSWASSRRPSYSCSSRSCTNRVPSVLWCSRCTPSSTIACPARAASSSGESCHTVSPFRRVVRFCSRSRAVMSWYRTIASSIDLPQPFGPTRHTSPTATVCTSSANNPVWYGVGINGCRLSSSGLDVPAGSRSSTGPFAVCNRTFSSSPVAVTLSTSARLGVPSAGANLSDSISPKHRVGVEAPQQLLLGQGAVVAEQPARVLQIVDREVGQQGRGRLDAVRERDQLGQHVRVVERAGEGFRLRQHLHVRQLGNVARLEAGPERWIERGASVPRHRQTEGDYAKFLRHSHQSPLVQQVAAEALQGERKANRA
uniref:Uncharacterized protein n=1 Tax=Anopheles melas TaxID=34690 RepID=A0A182UJF5_9DIPT